MSEDNVGELKGRKTFWIVVGVLALLVFTGVVLIGRTVPKKPVQTEAVSPPPVAEETVPETPKTAAVPAAPAAIVTFADLEKELAAAPLAGTLKMEVPVLDERERHLPPAYTCYRSNKSPPVNWSDAPAGTKSFVLVFEKLATKAPSPVKGALPVDKPQAVHWALFNIPAESKGVPEALPKDMVFKDGTAEATNDRGAPSYQGPCDPRGKFDFMFRVFALDQTLAVKPGASLPELVRAMRGHVLDMAEAKALHYWRF